MAANYVTLRKGQRATVEDYYNNGAPNTRFRNLSQQSMSSSLSMLDLRTPPRPTRPAPLPPKRIQHAVMSPITTRNLSQQSMSSVSMLDLRGPRTPVRPAPLPPQKKLSPIVESYKPINTSTSMVDLRKQPVRTPPRPPKRDSSTKQNIHKTNSGPSILNPIAEQVVKSGRKSSKFSLMQKRLQARLTGDSVSSSSDEDESQQDREIPELPLKYTYPTESQTLPRKFRIGQPSPDLNLPSYILKGPARSAPPPPKSTKKMVYRRLPLVQTNKSAPAIPSRHQPPPPPPPSIKTIPTKHTPPPPPFSRPDSSEFDQQESDIYELPSGCMPPYIEAKTDGFSKGRSPRTPLPSPPPPPIPPTIQVETADDIYETPGNALAAEQEQLEDDYTTMDFNPAMLYSVVKPKSKSNQNSSKEIMYSEINKLSPISSISPPPLPPKPSHQPPVPNPATPEVDLYEECQSGNGEIYETL